MKGKSLLLLVLSLLLVLGLGGGIGGLWAKGPEAPGEAPLLATLVDSAINYQGRLTDKNTGNPLSGFYDFGFHFYDDEFVGSEVGAVDVTNVEVIDGLFNIQIPVTQSWFNGQARWLGVLVRLLPDGSWEQLGPRQEILPVPYALSLKPGAVIADTDSLVELNRYRASGLISSKIGVYGEATGGALFTTGVYGSGTTGGVSGSSDSGTGVSGQSTSGSGVYGSSDTGAAIYAAGKIQSNVDSYIWVNANSYVEYLDGDFGLATISTGILQLTATGVGDATIELPAAIPLVFYGQPVKVEQIELCYYTTNSATYIDRFTVFKTSNTGGATTLVSVDTNFGDTTYTCRAYTPAAGTQLMAADEGGLSTTIWVHGGAAGHQINIYGLRIKLGHAG